MRVDTGRYRSYFDLQQEQMKLPYILLSVFAMVLCPVLSRAQNVRFGNETTDTTAINDMLALAAGHSFATPEARVAFFARMFEGTPYAAHTLEGEPETLTIRIDSLDCTTFVETVMALAYTIGEGRSSWRDFVYNLRRLRYRGGEVDGYASRLHYISDWAVDNKYRGNFADATYTFPRTSNIVRTIDFMTANRHRYPAMADSATYERIRGVENGYRNHRFNYVKTIDLVNKDTKSAFRDGDVVALVSNLKDLDVTHMGIIVKANPTAEPYLLHASSTDGVVEVTARPLAEFMKKNRQWLGLRVFRLVD